MTCVKCKVRQIEALMYNKEYYPEHKLAFCSVCRNKGFLHGIIPTSQYVKYWVLKSKPYVEARKRNS